MNLTFDLIKDIILTPQAGWKRINSDEFSDSDLIKNYLSYLVLIPVVAGFFGALFSGDNFFGSMFWAGSFFILAIAGSIFAARILTFLALNYQADQNYQTYLKIVIYSVTPIFVSNIFFLFPRLYKLSFVGIFGLYLFWTAFTKTVNCPEQNKSNFVILSLGVFVLTLFLMYLIPAMLFNASVY